MTNSIEITDEWVLKDTSRKLRILLAEEKKAEIEKENRDKVKARLKLLYEEYNNGIPFEEYEVNTAELGEIKILPPNDRVFTKNYTGEQRFEYPIKGTWAERIIAVFKYKNRVLKISDIFDVIKPHEPNYNKKQLINLISNTVNTALVGKDLLKIYDPPFKTKGFYYGSPLWWDENGQLKQEHIYELKPNKIWE